MNIAKTKDIKSWYIMNFCFQMLFVTLTLRIDNGACRDSEIVNCLQNK